MKLLLLPLVSIFSTSVLATPEPVNCREEISYKPIYAGPVECNDSYTQRTCEVTGSRKINLITKTHTQTLYGTATPTTMSTKVLREMVTFQESFGAGPGACTLPKTVSEELSCNANIPFSHNEVIKSNVCDYKPVAQFHVAERQQVSSFNVLSSSYDQDGNIVKYNWLVDGAPYGNAATITLPYRGSQTSTYQIQLKVTDNDGYTNLTSRTVTVKNDECNTPSCRNR